MNRGFENYSTADTLVHAAEAIRQHMTAGTIDAHLSQHALTLIEPFEVLMESVREAKTNRERFAAFELADDEYAKLGHARRAIQKALQTATYEDEPQNLVRLSPCPRWLVAGR